MSRPLEIGQFRYLVRWQARGVSATLFIGSKVPTLESKGTFWARIEPLKGWTASIASEIQSGAIYEISILTEAPIAPGDRLALDGGDRVFSVVTAYRAMDPINAILAVTATEV